MAVLALAATIVPLVQLSFQAALKLKNIARKLRHAPQNLRRNYRSTDGFYMLHALNPCKRCSCWVIIRWNPGVFWCSVGTPEFWTLPVDGIPIKFLSSAFVEALHLWPRLLTVFDLLLRRRRRRWRRRKRRRRWRKLRKRRGEEGEVGEEDEESEERQKKRRGGEGEESEECEESS